MNIEKVCTQLYVLMRGELQFVIMFFFSLFGFVFSYNEILFDPN